MVTTADPTRNSKRTIGIVAVLLLVFLYLLEFFGYLTFLDWLILVAVVFLVANYLLRRQRRPQL